ncbi:MAG: cadherin-like domain-containing protein, partial [Pseudomonadota bacterium]
MFDGAAAATAAEQAAPPPEAEAPAPADDGGAAPVDGATQGAAAPVQVAFVDAGIPDVVAITAALPAGVEVVMLSADSDGFTQMADWLSGRGGIDAIHVFGHGSAGGALLGTGTLSQASLPGYGDTLSTIGDALSADGDILFYGCSIGADGALVDSIAGLTRADVAASTDATGAAALGGDWDLERSSGTVEAASITAADFGGLLATPADQDWTSATGDGSSSLSVGGVTYSGNGDAILKVIDSANTTDNWYVTSITNLTGNVLVTDRDGLGSANMTYFRIASDDGTEFKFASIDINSVGVTWGNWAEVFTITGLKDGQTVATVTDFNFTSASGIQGTGDSAITYTKVTGHVAGRLVFGSGWQNVDTVQFTTTSGYGLGFFVDNVNFEPAVSNAAPTIGANTGITLNEGATTTITTTQLSISDTDTAAASRTLTVGTAPANGSLWLDSDGNGSINGAEAALGNGGTFTQADIEAGRLKYAHNGSETTSDSFTFTVSDGAGGSIGSTTFNFTVTAQNDPPTVATNTGITLNEGATATIANTHLNEGDPDDSGAGLTYTVTTTVANGTLWVDSDGNGAVNGAESALGNGATFTQADIDASRLKYAHNGSETTSDSFVFSLADGGENGAAAVTGQTFSITVTPQNDVPTLGGTFTTAGTVNDTATTSPFSQVTVSDAENNNVTLTVTFTGANGELSSAGNPAWLTRNSAGNFTLAATDAATQTTRLQSLVFTPTANQVAAGGTVQTTFTITPADAGTGSANATTVVTATSVNDAPVAVNDAGTATETGNLAGTNATGNVLDNDTDADTSPSRTVASFRTGGTEGAGTAGTLGQALTGTYGSLTLATDGTYTYVVDQANATVQALVNGQTLTESFNYTMSDGAASDTGVLVITINGAVAHRVVEA